MLNNQIWGDEQFIGQKKLEIQGTSILHTSVCECKCQEIMKNKALYRVGRSKGMNGGWARGRKKDTWGCMIRLVRISINIYIIYYIY